MGQLTNISYSDGTPGVSFAFDRLGRPSGFTAGPDYTVNYAFDALGRLWAASTGNCCISRVRSGD